VIVIPATNKQLKAISKIKIKILLRSLMTFSPANDGKTKDQLIPDILSYLTLREICDIP
jgi:hypothetical protein